MSNDVNSGDTSGRGDRNAPPTEGGATVRLTSSPAEQYIAGVRAALSDLPAPEVAEILDDVRAHLADLLADVRADRKGGAGDGERTDGADLAALTARLGTPAAYAAELRAAAGYPPAPQVPEGPTGMIAARLAVAGLVGSTFLFTVAALSGVFEAVLLGVVIAFLAVPMLTRDGPDVRTVVALTSVRRLLAGRPVAGSASRTVTDFVVSLQPAWWLVRAVVAAAILVMVVGSYDLGPVILVSLIAVPVSVWLGLLSRRDRRWLWAVVPLNGFAAGLLLAGLTAGSFGGPSPDSGYSTPTLSGLWQDSDRQVLDVRPFDATGVPLSGVYLFDQDGQPLDTGSNCSDGYSEGTGFDSAVPDPARPYPRGVTDYDSRTGRCVTVPPEPLVVAVPARPTASPTPVPSASPQLTTPVPGQPPPAPAPAPSLVPSPAPAPPPPVPPTTTAAPVPGN